MKSLLKIDLKQFWNKNYQEEQSDTKDIALIRIDLDRFKPINTISMAHPIQAINILKIFRTTYAKSLPSETMFLPVFGGEMNLLFCGLILILNHHRKKIFEESKDWVLIFFMQQIAFRGFSYMASSTDELNPQQKYQHKRQGNMNRTADQKSNHHKLP